VPTGNAPNGRALGNGQGARTLVIGCGFIGSHVVATLSGQGRAPVVLTRSLPDKAIAGLVAESELHLGDAQSPEILERALTGVDQVIFSAGGLLPAASEQDPELDERLTLGPVRAVLEALRSRPGVSLTYLSSGGTVYGEPDRVPVGEEAPTRAFGAYGRLHLACEREIERDRAEHGLRARILRCATVYGEHQNPDRGQGVIATFLHRIERGEPVELYGDGSMVRDYVYAGDVARATVALTDLDGGPSVVNVGAGQGTSLLEVLRMAEKQVGRQAEVIHHAQRGFDVHTVVLDTERLHGLVEVEITPLPTGIGRTHRWLTARSPELA
jgi:UDP-glucose 4-epimerase